MKNLRFMKAILPGSIIYLPAHKLVEDLVGAYNVKEGVYRHPAVVLSVNNEESWRNVTTTFSVITSQVPYNEQTWALVKEICENMSNSGPCWCPKLHLQGPQPLHEEGTYRSFVEFRGHYTLPWEVFRRWESKLPGDLRLTDESLAELKGEK